MPCLLYLMFMRVIVVKALHRRQMRGRDVPQLGLVEWRALKNY